MQLRDASKELRTHLWNAMETTVDIETVRTRVVRDAWIRVFVIPLTDHDPTRTWDGLRGAFFSCIWYSVYELLEIALELFPESRLRNELARALVRGNSGYRLLDDRFIPITDETQNIEIERARSAAEPLAGVRTHLDTALERYADRKAPDYRNSIKESISAIEALVARINGKNDTLGNGLKGIEQRLPVHPAMMGALSKLYGYASDADGIRHALKDGRSAGEEDARFMLVTASAYVTYLIAKAKTAGLNLDDDASLSRG